MTIDIKVGTIQNCNTGISMPKDADAKVDVTNINNCITAIELRDPPGFIESLGLKEDTPTEKIIAVLTAISEGCVGKKDIQDQVEKAGLLDYLSGATNVSSLVSVFYKLYTSSLVQNVLTVLKQ